MEEPLNVELRARPERLAATCTTIAVLVAGAGLLSLAGRGDDPRPEAQGPDPGAAASSRVEISPPRLRALTLLAPLAPPPAPPPVASAPPSPILQTPGLPPALPAPAVAAPPPPPADPAPSPAPPPPPPPPITDLLTSEDGTLRTHVGRYSDCSGHRPLPRHEAEIDTCMAGPVYFLGHNPGVFTPLMHMDVGSILVWNTHRGSVKRLRVVAVRDMTATAPRTPTDGAVIAQFQTCVDLSGAVDRIFDAVAA